jgi:hypothetical protein
VMTQPINVPLTRDDVPLRVGDFLVEPAIHARTVVAKFTSSCQPSANQGIGANHAVERIRQWCLVRDIRRSCWTISFFDIASYGVRSLSVGRRLARLCPRRYG